MASSEPRVSSGAAACDHEDGHCITCSDEATPMRVLEIDPGRDLALCAGPDESHASVEIALVHPVAAGDTLLVHAGTAIAHATPDPATEGAA